MHPLLIVKLFYIWRLPSPIQNCQYGDKSHRKISFTAVDTQMHFPRLFVETTFRTQVEVQVFHRAVKREERQAQKSFFLKRDVVEII